MTHDCEESPAGDCEHAQTATRTVAGVTEPRDEKSYRHEPYDYLSTNNEP